MAPGSGASTGGTAGAVPSPKPAAWAARAPAAAPSAKAGGEAEAAIGGAGHLQRLRGPAGQEDPARLLERELAGRLAEEMHRRVPAAGNEHAIAGDAAHGAANPAIPCQAWRR